MKKFYPEYIAQKKKRGESTEMVEKFIKEMNDIAVVVKDFLNKYKDHDSRLDNRDLFKNDLTETISALKMRIETEEDGVYSLFLVG